MKTVYTLKTDLELLYKSPHLDPDRGPRELLNKVQFDIRYYFCQRGLENIYEMKKDTFEFGYCNDTQMGYVFKAKDELQKNHKEFHNPIITGFMPEMKDPTTGLPHKMCPVRSYTNYYGALNERCDYLWQTPNVLAYNKGEPNWFKNKRLGENKIASFMTDLSKTVGLSKNYTNHCIRVTGTTQLTRAHFSSNQIMAVTGHKSVNSLAMYQRVESNEKLMMGVSLQFSLINAKEVYAKTHEEQQKEIQNEPQPAAPPPRHTPTSTIVKEEQKSDNNEEKQQEDIDLSNVQLQQLDPNANFNLLDLINEVCEDEMVMAATQMEKEYEKENQIVRAKTTSTVVVKSPKKLPMPVFSNCKIGNINIQIHKS